MTYRIEILPSAERELLGLPHREQPLIRDRILTLAGNPRPPGSRKVRGLRDTWRIRSGRYRVVFTIDDRAHKVVVVRVRHRKNVYR